jgi:hypothetical protein
MSIVDLLALATIGVAAFLRGRLRFDHIWTAISGLVATGACVVLLLRGFEPVVPPSGGLVGSVFDGACVFIGGLILVDLVGLPRPIAYRLGLGCRWPEWEFDHRYFAAAEAFARAANRARDPGEREAMLAEARRCEARIRGLRAPTAEWQALCAARADAAELWINLTERKADPAAFENHARIMEGVRARYRELQHRYQAEVVAARRSRFF